MLNTQTRLRQARAEPMVPVDFLACLISDELGTRSDRLLERRRKQARFRSPHCTRDNFDFTFNPKMNRSLVFDLATGGFIAKHEDALFLGPVGMGKNWPSRVHAGLSRYLSRDTRLVGRSRRGLVATA
jgi:DNA replication protein DnaC